MPSLLEQHSPGDTIEITTLRDDEIQTYQLDLAAPLAD
jgi:hypothetical protein